MGFWRRCPLDGSFTRTSNYIDDVTSVAAAFDTVQTRIPFLIICCHLSQYATSPPTGNEDCNPHGFRIGRLGIVPKNLEVLLFSQTRHEGSRHDRGP